MDKIVEQKNGKWYFECHSEGMYNGPYDKEADAWEAYHQYNLWLAAMDAN